MEVVKLLNLRNSLFPSLCRSFLVNRKLNLFHSDIQVNRFSWLSGCITRNNNFNNLSLTSYNPLLVPSCGMRVKGHLKLRCKDCYFERKDEQLYVNCTSYPRHKQTAVRKSQKRRWILSHAFQTKYRPY